MTDDRKLTAAEADQVLARAASLDSESEGGLSAEDVRSSALAAGIAPQAVERALREVRSPVPAASGDTGRFMGLPAILRASASAPGAPKRTPKEIAMKLRGVLGPDAVIAEELGTVRARVGHTVVTVVPGASTTVSVSADHSGDVAVTGLAGGAGGLVAGMFTMLALGFGSSVPAILAAIPVGSAFGLSLWRGYWRQKLAVKAREVDALASAVAAALDDR